MFLLIFIVYFNCNMLGTNKVVVVVVTSLNFKLISVRGLQINVGIQGPHLRWLKTVSSTFQDSDFDASL